MIMGRLRTMVDPFLSVRMNTERCRRPQMRRRRVDRGHLVFFTAVLLSATAAVYPNITPSVLAADTRHIKATAYYYPKSFRERNGMAKPENLDFTKISRVNYASFQLDDSGSVWGTVSILRTFIYRLAAMLFPHLIVSCTLGLKCRCPGAVRPNRLESPE